MRILGALIYLGSTALWGFLTLVAAALRCDESCGTGGGWGNDASVWQWSAIGWLGVVGAELAILALLLSLVSRPLAVAAFAAHLFVFA